MPLVPEAPAVVEVVVCSRRDAENLAVFEVVAADVVACDWLDEALLLVAADFVDDAVVLLSDVEVLLPPPNEGTLLMFRFDSWAAHCVLRSNSGSRTPRAPLASDDHLIFACCF